MKKLKRHLLITTFLALASAVVMLFSSLLFGKTPADNAALLDKPPKITPDYTNTVIPPNIAPLNFFISEDAKKYHVKIYSKNGPEIEITSKNPNIIIHKKSWRKLLNANKNQQLFFDIFVKKQNGQWLQFSTVTNKIAPENIDSFLVYRKIHPVHSGWREMGIYQRNLQSYRESVLFDNRFYRGLCLNCHAFSNYKPDKMFIGTRGKKYGSTTLLAQNSNIKKLNTKFGYTSWHPSGKLVIFSINKVRQHLHAAKNEIRDVFDLDSLLAYYRLDSNTIKTAPQIAKKDRLETYPAWSPDGKYLYFSSAQILWTDKNKIPPDNYDKVKYDLVRISYDIQNDKWGRLQTILSADDTGLSILQPRISPDGKWLLVTMCDYGCFPVYQQSSDLYLVDLNAAEESGNFKYRKLDINSQQSESWHAFSSNSKWLAFSSKRKSHLFTRTFFSYIDENGNLYKPFLLPQKDPEFYDSCLFTFTVPEFLTEPVNLQPRKLQNAIRSSQKVALDMPITMATPKAGQIPAHEEPWPERE